MSKWISVDDIFPPDYEEVLYVAINELNRKCVMTGHREKGNWTHCCFFYSTQHLSDVLKVTHWMWLPEFPKDK